MASVTRVGNMYSLHGSNCMVVGPHWPMLFCTYSLICAPSIFFFVLVAPTREAWEWILFTCLFIVTVGSFSVTAFKDPGICPQTTPPAAADDEDVITFSPDASVPAAASGSFRCRTRKFCRYCNVHQPIDSVHCLECGVCIVGLDHHCPWTGKCIGRGNMVFFQTFLFGLVGLVIAFIVMSVQYATDTGGRGE